MEHKAEKKLAMKRDENQNVESWHDKYLEWICGYANAKGGTLYIGIASLGVGLAAGERRMSK